MQDIAAKLFWNFENFDNNSQQERTNICNLLALDCLGKTIPLLILSILSIFLSKINSLPENYFLVIIFAALANYLTKAGAGLSVGILRVVGRSDVYAFFILLELLIRLSTIILFIYFSKFDVVHAIAALMFSGVCANIGQWLWLYINIPQVKADTRVWSSRGLFEGFREFRRLFFVNIGISISELTAKDLDVVIIAPFFMAEAVGVYKMGKTMVMFVWKTVDPLSLALMPEIAKLAAQFKFDRIRKLVFQTSVGILFISTCMSVALYLMLLNFGTLILDPSFSTLPSLLPFMLFGIIISSPLIWGHPLTVALNRVDITLVGSFIGLIVGIASFLILVPALQLKGAGIAWAITFVVNFGYVAAASINLLNGEKRKFDAKSD